MNEVSLERLYEVLKTYELEQIQQKEIYGKGRVVSATTALVAEVPQKVKRRLFNLLVLIRKPLLLSMVSLHPINLMVISIHWKSWNSWRMNQ